MSFRVVRASKFRHVFGKEFKKQDGYDGIKISRNAWDSPMSDVNAKFLAIILEAQGGGAFMVLNIDQVGRVDLNAPKVTGHQAAVLDLQFCPFNDNIIASGSEDCLVKVWEIPDGGLTENLDESLVDLEGHQRRVGIVKWHPTAENILLSAGFDYLINIWDIAQAAAVKQIACHTDTIYCIDWNFDGSLLVTTSKDKKLRIIDPRAETVIAEGKSHDGTKGARCCFVGEKNWVFTTGFSRMSERQYAIWNPEDLSKAKKLENLDTGSGVLFPTYDEDTRMVYVGGKGDGNIRYFEIDDAAPYAHSLSEYKSSAPQRGLSWFPKTTLDINKCEVARCVKLHPKGFAEVIGFTVPRKSTMFQDDLYPDTREPVAVLTADEWIGGATKPPQKISLKDGFVPTGRSAPKRASGGGSVSAKPAVAASKPKVVAASGVNPYAKKAGVNPYAKKAAAPAPAEEPAAVAAAPAAAPAPAGGSSEREEALEAEVKTLKTKLATKEIEIARLKKALAAFA